MSSYARRAQRVVDFARERYPQVPSDARRAVLGLYEHGVQFSKQRSVARQAGSWSEFMELAREYMKTPDAEPPRGELEPPREMGTYASIGWLIDQLELRWGAAPEDVLGVFGDARGVGFGPVELAAFAARSANWEELLDQLDERTESLED